MVRKTYSTIGHMARSRQDRIGQRRNRRYGYLAALVVLLAVGWSAVWFYASTKADDVIAAWRAREARAGRDYTCGHQSIGGFPFRIEVLCDNAMAVLRGTQPPIELKATNLHVAWQIYQPDLLLTEYDGPLTVGEPGKPIAYTARWSLAQSSVRGTPAEPERVSLALDDPVVERANAAGPVFTAKHAEVHGRLAGGSVNADPVIDFAVRLDKSVAPPLGPMATTPLDAVISGTLRGLKDFRPKPWAARFREIAAAGGVIDIKEARLEQGPALAVGKGALTINAQGRLDGTINLAVAGIEGLINAIGAATQQRTGIGFTLGLGLLSGNAKVEGRNAIALPLRISDGDVYLGPIRIGQIPPVF